MKQFVFLSIVYIWLLPVQGAAQRIPGTYVAGATLGGFSFERTPSNGAVNKRMAISLSPMLGRFFTSNLLVGAGATIGLSNFKTKYDDANRIDQTTNGTDIGIKVFVRNYFGSKKEKFWPYAELQAGAGKSSTKSTSGIRVTGSTPANSYRSTTEQNTDRPFWQITAAAGATYMFSRFTGLDVNLGYQYSRHRFESSNETITRYDDGTENESGYQTDLKTRKGHLVVNVGILIFLNKLGKEN